jgi:hypothetical protein
MTTTNDQRSRIQTTIRQTLTKNSYTDHMAEQPTFDGYNTIVRTKSNNGYSLLIKNHKFTYSKLPNGQPFEVEVHYHCQPIYQSAIHTKCESFDTIPNVSVRNLFLYLNQIEKWPAGSHLQYKPF